MLMGISFAVTLAVIIGKRMSTDALAVVIGVTCGVLASVPVSLLILAITSRRDEQVVFKQPSPPPPTVIIVQDGHVQRLHLPTPPDDRHRQSYPLIADIVEREGEEGFR